MTKIVVWQGSNVLQAAQILRPHLTTRQYVSDRRGKGQTRQAFSRKLMDVVSCGNTGDHQAAPAGPSSPTWWKGPWQGQESSVSRRRARAFQDLGQSA
eukprot:4372706-Amphidinium_carterae.3